MIVYIAMFWIVFAVTFVVGELHADDSKPHRLTLPLTAVLSTIGLVTEIPFFLLGGAIVMMLQVMVFDPLSEKEGRESWRKRTRGFRTVRLD